MAEERLVGFFDLLGYKSYVKSQPLETVIQSFTKLFYAMFSSSVRHSFRMGASSQVIETKYDVFTSESNLMSVKERFEAETGFKVLLLSDSIVLYSEEIDRDHPSFLDRVTTLILVSRVLMMTLFEQVLPTRGALAYGEFHADPDYQIYCGRALVEAYEFAESQDWIGAVVSESLAQDVALLVKSFKHGQYFEGLTSGKGWNLARPNWDIVKYKVPFKLGPKSCWVVNWASAWNYGGPIRDDFFADVMTGEEHIDIKYQNTLEFMKSWPRSVFIYYR